MSSRLLVISPCRDEQGHLEACIASVAAQSLRPDLWVIVDDGSTDRTSGILAEAAARHPFIRVLRRDDRGDRSVGAGVVEAFYAGLESLPPESPRQSFEFICKLDADLELPARYFELCVREMRRDPRLGNFSGKVYLRDDDGTLHPERMGDENAIGAAKFYRSACFEDIGGFVRHAGWDGIDGHLCRLKGWIARSADEPDLRIIHRRLMGSSHRSIAHGRRRWGLAKWYMGSSLPYMLAVAAYRMAERPRILGGLWILEGYIRAMLSRTPRLETPGFRAHLRRYEWRSLLRGKARTAEQFHAMIRAGAPVHPLGPVAPSHEQDGSSVRAA